MYYFVNFDSTGEVDSIGISENKTEIETENAFYVSEEECLRLKKQIAKKIELENQMEEERFLAEQRTIEQLEKENAALLYQLLTGEEFADV